MPIVEPEVLSDGAHSIEVCEAVTQEVRLCIRHISLEMCFTLVHLTQEARWTGRTPWKCARRSCRRCGFAVLT